MLHALLSIGRDAPAEHADRFHSVWTASGTDQIDQIDQALRRLDGHRLVIDVQDGSDLNRVLARMLRARLLAEVETAVIAAREVPYLSRLGLPADRSGQLAVALAGSARLVGVIKDDSGGVCVSGAELEPWADADTWWVRAVVDDQRLCDGNVRSLSVRHLAPGLVQAQVKLGRFRSRTLTGRSLQLACDPAQITADGIRRQRSRSRRTFWSDPELWRLALPA
jgi:hypothetical protein